MRAHPTWWRALALVAGVSVLALSAVADPTPSPPVSAEDVPRIKAAIIYSVCKFVEWPSRGTPADGKIVLGLLGADEDEPAFETVDGKKIGPLTLEIRRIEQFRDVVHCQVVYVARSEAPILAEYLDVLEGLPILTISEIDRFGDVGGVLQIKETGSKLGFRVNLEAARNSGLVLSSQLLKVAEIVQRVD